MKDMKGLYFQVLKRELFSPISIFSDTYADSTSSESQLREQCDIIAKCLNEKEIKFSAFDGGYYLEISVEEESLSSVKEIATTSSIKAWIDFLLRK